RRSTVCWRPCPPGSSDLTMCERSRAEPIPIVVPSPTPEPAPASETRVTASVGGAEPARSAADLRAAAAGPLAQRLSPKYLEEHCLLPVGVNDGGELIVAAGDVRDPAVIVELCWTYVRRV